MSAVTKSLGSLVQGISQQNVRDRQPGQLEDQRNMQSDPVQGMTRRPSADFNASLMTEAQDFQWHHFSSKGARFYTALGAGTIRIWNEFGAEIPVVTTAEADAYIDGTNFSVATVPEIGTFVANRDVVTAMRSELSRDASRDQAIVYCLGGKYGSTYSVTIRFDGFVLTASYTTPNGSSASHTSGITTTVIASNLATGITSHADFVASGATLTRAGDVILIVGNGSNDMTVVADDGESGTTLRGFTDVVDDVSKLSRYATHGTVIRVEGSSETGDDAFYMEFNSDSGDTIGSHFGTQGSWLETVAPGIPLGFEPTTMPFILTQDDTGFSLDVTDWSDREAGNEKSNPEPSFIGYAINDIGSFQERLSILAGPSVVMSRTNEAKTFWIETATGQLDTDPLDFASTTVDVEQLVSLVPHDRDLVIFAPEAQFIIFGRNKLTPDNASLVLTTVFESNLSAAPVPSGKVVFFCFDSGKFTGVKEFFTQGSLDANDSRPITQHVDKFIEGTPFHMSASSTFDMMIVHTGYDRSVLYVYEYLWVDNEKVQTAWHKWYFNDEVLYSDFDNSMIRLIMRNGDEHYMQTIDLDVDDDADVGHHVYLDRKFIATDVETGVVLPYEADLENLVFVQSTGCPNPGLVLRVATKVGSTVTFEQSFDAEDNATVICGVKIPRSGFTPTTPLVRDDVGDVAAGYHLVLDKYIVAVTDTGPVDTTLTSKYREDRPFRWSARIMGSPGNILGQSVVTTDTFEVPIGERSDWVDIAIYTDGWAPLTVTDIDYIGQIHGRGKRLTRRR